MGPSCCCFLFFSSAMEIRAGQRPPRSKPEDQTSLSASTGLLGKCWKVFFNENMEKKINKDKMMKKKKWKRINLLLHLSSQFPGPKLWASHGSRDAPSKRGVLHSKWYFYLFPPSAIKVGDKEKKICIPYCWWSRYSS